MSGTTLSLLLQLPAELRTHIWSLLIHIAPATSSPDRDAAVERGFSSGVGLVTLLLRDDDQTWRSVAITKPAGFCFTAPAILRVSREVHNEVMDVLYSGILWVIDPVIRVSGPIRGAAEDNSMTMFMNRIRHVHIAQHIRPGHDLLYHARTLKAALECLGSRVKTLQVALYFDPTPQLLGKGARRTLPGTQKRKNPKYDWKQYQDELSSMNLGTEPQFSVAREWLKSKGQKRFEQLAASVGGKVNSEGYIHWWRVAQHPSQHSGDA